MQIFYQANDIAEAITQMLIDTWPRSDNGWDDWQKVRFRVRVARNIVRRLYQQQTYTLDAHLLEIFEDLDVLHNIADYRSHRRSTRLPLRLMRHNRGRLSRF